MELMRHSDMKLTMGVYTDVAQLPVIAEAARLPSLRIPNTPKTSSHPLPTYLATYSYRKKTVDAGDLAASGYTPKFLTKSRLMIIKRRSQSSWLGSRRTVAELSRERRPE